jgi:hypothetical protein
MRVMFLISLMMGLLAAGCQVPETAGDAAGDPCGDAGADCLGGQTGEEMPIPCEESSEVVPADDDAAGFSAEDLLAAFGASRAALTWSDGATDGLSLSLTLAGEVTFIESTPSSDEVDEELCVDRLLFGGRLALESDDGALSEALDLELWASELSALEGDAALVASSLEGDWADGAQEGWLSASWDEDGPSGLIELYGAGWSDQAVTWMP